MSEPAAMSERALQGRGYKKPMSRNGAWCCPQRADTEYQTGMITGSDALLRAIWRSHSRVMLVGKALGRQVVIPNQKGR